MIADANALSIFKNSIKLNLSNKQRLMEFDIDVNLLPLC